ncbi:MAG TPA: ArsR family transcriptional regulator [Amycolatopsis sp.]|nr:ArsR family transcriptional regulator [Amycolatopsis sp.]
MTRSEALTNKQWPSTSAGIRRRLSTMCAKSWKPVPGATAAPCREARGQGIPYLSTGLSWTLLAKGTGYQRDIAQALLEAYLAEIAELGVGELRQRRLMTHLDPEEREEFERRVGRLLDEFETKRARPGAENIVVYIATYPSR